MSELKGYFLPKSLEDLEEKLEFTEKKVGDYTVKLPVIKPEHIKIITQKLKENRDSLISDAAIDWLAQIYNKVSSKWKGNSYKKKKIAMEILPLLTGLTKEVIEFYQFSTIYKINYHNIIYFGEASIPEEAFKKFTRIKGIDVMVRSYASFVNKLKFARAIKNPRVVRLVTYITPSNVPGLIEVLGLFLSSLARAASITKTPSIQPIFAPLYAESIQEVDEGLTETIAVIPWKGGNLEIEDILFRNSDVVSVVSSTKTANSVKKRIDNLRKNGYEVKGCYHGGKFGFVIISREYTTREVADLAILDGFGYEGYMCSSPAFGFFIERGGQYSPQEFAELLVKEGTRFQNMLPQGKLFRKNRELKVSELLLKEELSEGMKVYHTQGSHFTVVYKPKIEFIPDGQDRIFKIIPIDDIYEVIPYLYKWKEYLQTMGFAIPKIRFMAFADKIAKIGITNFRVIGSVTLPRFGEAWDGYYPLIEFITEDYVKWVSINVEEMDKGIYKQINWMNNLINKFEEKR